jgi:hypothetical protein
MMRPPESFKLSPDNLAGHLVTAVLLGIPRRGKSDRNQPAAKQGCENSTLTIPVLLPSLPCSTVKNSLIFFQLGKDEMTKAKWLRPFAGV